MANRKTLDRLSMAVRSFLLVPPGPKGVYFGYMRDHIRPPEGSTEMALNRKEVEVHLPLENLIDTLARLPAEDLREIERLIHDKLGMGKEAVPGISYESEFWETRLGREILAKADSSVTLEGVLEITSKIKGSIAADVAREREER